MHTTTSLRTVLPAHVQYYQVIPAYAQYYQPMHTTRWYQLAYAQYSTTKSMQYQTIDPNNYVFHLARENGGIAGQV